MKKLLMWRKGSKLFMSESYTKRLTKAQARKKRDTTNSRAGYDPPI